MFQQLSFFVRMPFSRGAITSRLFPGSGQEELKARLACLVRERGIGLIAGQIGSGRSTTLQAFVDSLDLTRYTVVYTANPIISVSGIYRDVLAQLGELVPMFRQQMVLSIHRCSVRPAALRNSCEHLLSQASGCPQVGLRCSV